ncbi:glycine--tRNA ligase subunit beta [Vagococcus carniphilus]|uniref:Glycine--tRNA ligase beta subunit n=1 Tax=Vagococcus carniphilus TaxID=218144 RepID=A0AAW8U7G8_9ENTE|nr:glycine--tRNA ligase subunit beta [Vagococcus carniphilus]MDT2829696.1 glycine--tRNA ligase subunit beta [Vagococcus carniphilus]MDT2834169.1 glycine--tRNA ligase subunit beta [Vagococcus carniphilus]MDT2839155.1 glycine--tRNA ligase subunit beta [Vagococcus carniphilus]MDT2853213.1 glycine--tRNA ligase subunit beta [Vagococcus carniphilus]
MTKQFLMEIGLEEIPAHIVTPSINQLVEKVTTFLNENRLEFTSIESFSTPRRLAIRVNELADKQTNIEEKAKGPAKRIALDKEGEWSKAALGFARGQQASSDDLFFEDFNGEEYVFVNKFIEGKLAEEVLSTLPKVVKQMTFPVSMHWANYDYKFIRPVHWLVSLLDEAVIPMTLFNVASDRISRGHRFLGKETEIAHAKDYEMALEKEFVMVDAAKRKETIINQIKEIERANSWIIPIDDNLLEEVNNLVEYPTAFIGDFEEQYLNVPSEILITSMKEHQRYFEVLSQTDDLLNHFIGVRNGNEEFIENVAKGNAKVLKARLEDAEFFYQEDVKGSIDSYVEKLKNVTFHEKIGSMFEKMQRVNAISKVIGKHVGLTDAELADLDRASQIYKFDLVTLMVDEFPELQGIIGEKYALLHGEKKEVAQAIREHYLPKSSDSDLPESNIGAVLAISEKIDTLITFFSVGLTPKGSNDPYALRRQAYGIIRIIESKGWTFPVENLHHEIETMINKNEEKFGLHLEETNQSIHTFLMGRMKQWFNGKNIRHDIIEAVIESRQDDLSQMFEVAEILKANATKNDFKPSVESLTRVINLASKADATGSLIVDESLFENESERNLYIAFNEIKDKASTLTLTENFDALKSLNPLIEAYFENTMVMVDDEKIRNNRLVQLREIAQMALSFASLDKLIVK